MKPRTDGPALHTAVGFWSALPCAPKGLDSHGHPLSEVAHERALGTTAGSFDQLHRAVRLAEKSAQALGNASRQNRSSAQYALRKSPVTSTATSSPSQCQVLAHKLVIVIASLKKNLGSAGH